MRTIKMITFLLLLMMLVGCQKWDEYSKDLAAADKALIEAELIDVSLSTEISIAKNGDQQSINDSLWFQMSIEPFFMYVIEPEPIILYENGGSYYQAQLGSPLTDDGKYVISPRKINATEAEAFSQIKVDTDTNYRFIDGTIEKTGKKKYKIKTTYENLLKDESVSDLLDLEEMMSPSQYADLLNTKVTVTMDLNDGITMNIVINMNIESFEIDLEMTMAMQASSSRRVDVSTDNRFSILEKDNIHLAAEIKVDQPVMIPANVDHRGYAYFKVFLEPGHYIYNSTDSLSPDFRDLNGNSYNLNVIPNQEELFASYPYKAMKVNEAGYYYFRVFIPGYDSIMFSIDHLHYDTYVSDEYYTITSGGTYNFEIEGLHDTVKFVYYSNKPAVIGVKGKTEGLVLVTNQSTSMAYYDATLKYTYAVNGPVTFYAIPYNASGVKDYQLTFEIYTQEDAIYANPSLMRTIGESYDFTIVTSEKLNKQFVKFVITESGDYVFTKNLIYDNVSNIGTLYQENQRYVGLIYHYNGSPTQAIHLDPGTYYIQLYSGQPSVYQLKYQLLK